jgi:hypothetical protein
MSEQFARLYIANLEKRREGLVGSQSVSAHIIYRVLNMEIDAIKETMLEMGHTL